MRAEIIDAASGELARTADASTITLRGIARAVGIATTSIYLHFASVEELVDAVKRDRFEQFNDLLRRSAAAAGTDPVARIAARAQAYVTFWEEHPGEYAVMFAARLNPDSGSPRGIRVADALDEMAADVAAAWGQDRLRPGSDAMLCAFHIWTSLHGTLTLRMLRPHLPWPALGTEIADLCDRLLRSGTRPD